MYEHTPSRQEQHGSASVETIYKDISAHAPKPVETFVPLDGEAQKQLFLDGAIRNPGHTYDRLDVLQPQIESAHILELASGFSDLLSNDPVSSMAYSEYANRYVLTYELLQSAKDSHSLDANVVRDAEVRFMELNRELYGAPDEDTYRSFINEAIRSIDAKELTPSMQTIRDDLGEMLPVKNVEISRFAPSSETVANMQQIAEYLYGGMFDHIPEDQEIFNPEEVAAVFRAIITNEFGKAAEGWSVVVTKAASINVDASKKLIKVPENRKPVQDRELRGLVAHELGVHMLRSITGEETDLPLLKTGLSDYYDAEEGLGKVMEQAVKGKYVEAGIPYYTVAGLMYFDKNDFRQTHEVMWRLNYLKSSKDSEEASEDKITATKEAAYKTIMRMTRGTDTLPWFKDLAYYTGTAKMWKYCESASQDPEKLMFLLMGKGDITNDVHRRIVFETKSI